MVRHFGRQVKQSNHAVKNCIHTRCENIGIHRSGAHYVGSTSGQTDLDETFRSYRAGGIFTG